MPKNVPASSTAARQDGPGKHDTVRRPAPRERRHPKALHSDLPHRARFENSVPPPPANPRRKTTKERKQHPKRSTNNHPHGKNNQLPGFYRSVRGLDSPILPIGLHTSNINLQISIKRHSLLTLTQITYEGVIRSTFAQVFYFSLKRPGPTHIHQRTIHARRHLPGQAIRDDWRPLQTNRLRNPQRLRQLDDLVFTLLARTFASRCNFLLEIVRLYHGVRPYVLHDLVLTAPPSQFDILDDPISSTPRVR